MMRLLVYVFLIILTITALVNTQTTFYRSCDMGRKYAQLVREYVLEPAAESNDSNNLLLAVQKVKQGQHALRLLSDQAGGTEILSRLIGQNLDQYSTWLQARYDTCMALIAQQSHEHHPRESSTPICESNY